MVSRSGSFARELRDEFGENFDGLSRFDPTKMDREALKKKLNRGESGDKGPRPEELAVQSNDSGVRVEKQMVQTADDAIALVAEELS